MILMSTAYGTPFFQIHPATDPDLEVALQVTHTFLLAKTPEEAYEHAHANGLLRQDGTFPATPSIGREPDRANSLLTAVHLRATSNGTALTHRLSHRMGSERPRPPNGEPVHPDDDLPGLPYHLIPCTIGIELLPDIDRLGLNTARGHQAIRLSLALYGTNRTVRNVLDVLDVPWRNSRLLTAELVRLQSASLDNHFLNAIDAIFRRLHQLNPDTRERVLARRRSKPCAAREKSGCGGYIVHRGEHLDEAARGIVGEDHVEAGGGLSAASEQLASWAAKVASMSPERSAIVKANSDPL